MFTGLIEEVGEIRTVRHIAGGLHISVASRVVLDGVSVGDSINIDGACQTVVDYDENGFTVEAVGDTITKTIFRNYRAGRAVNLERSLRADSRLGGHFVQGHVNGVGVVERFERVGENYSLVVNVPDDLERYIVAEGSIAFDGISLTVAELDGTRVRASIIPETARATTLHHKAAGAEMNVEVDIIGKYVEKFLAKQGQQQSSFGEKLAQWGY